MAPGAIVSEAERVVVMVAYNAVIRFYESGVFFVEDDRDEYMCRAMLRNFWRMFLSKMPSDVRGEVGDISKKFYNRFGANDAYRGNDEDDEEEEEITIRKRCVRIVQAFLDAMTELSEDYLRFVFDYSDDEGDQYYPRALWHAFFRKLSRTVRQAAFSVHEQYIRDYVYDRNVDEFETDKIPVGALFFEDEASREPSRRLRNAASPLPPVERKRKRFFDTDSDDDEVIVPPAKSYRSETDVASAAHDALAEIVNNGSVVASANAPPHTFGVIGQWWDTFKQHLALRAGPKVANGIATASGVAYNFFRSQAQEE